MAKVKVVIKKTEIYEMEEDDLNHLMDYCGEPHNITIEEKAKWYNGYIEEVDDYKYIVGDGNYGDYEMNREFIIYVDDVLI